LRGDLSGAAIAGYSSTGWAMTPVFTSRWEKNMLRRSSVVRCAAAMMVGALAAALFLGADPPSASAEGFRIETKIFAGEEEEPASKTTTLFQEGVVYDFLEKPQQTAVFRKASGQRPARFVLMNDAQQVQTEVPTEKLTATMRDLREWASQQKNPYLQFSADPRFDETFDRESGKLVLASPLQTYTVETAPTQHQDLLGAYREYLDWYAQLNALMVNKIPPDPRLKLNASLARHNVVPTKVELKRGGEDSIRAEHDFTWRLSKKDVERVEDVHNALTTYKTVDNAEFLKLSQPVGK
jgi:hypothetical protein